MYTYGVDYYVGDVDVVINNFGYGYVSMDVSVDVDVGICGYGNGYNDACTYPLTTRVHVRTCLLFIVIVIVIVINYLSIYSLTYLR